MNLDDKVTHLRESAMSAARAQSNAIIENHRNTLEDLLVKHKEEAKIQSEIRIKSETTKARRQLNQATAKAQTELKRNLGRCQQDLKKKLFDEIEEMLSAYRKTEEYTEYLFRKIREAAVFANGEELTIYITPEDADKKEALEARTGMQLHVSEYGFKGGIRAVIRGRNVLIDHSFESALEAEYQKFQFGSGGNGIA